MSVANRFTSVYIKTNMSDHQYLKEKYLMDKFLPYLFYFVV
jgi:hypothetical protein